MAFDPTTAQVVNPVTAQPAGAFDPSTAQAFDPTTATPVQSPQDVREATRPDMRSVLQTELNTPYQSDPSTRLATMDVPNMVKAAITGAKTLGYEGQATESALATPIVNRIRALKGEPVPSLGTATLQGLTGQSKAEFGDAFRELGLPEWISAPAGLVTAAFSDPTQAGYKVGSTAAREVESHVSAIASGVKKIIASVGLNKNPAASQYLADQGYLRMSEKHFAPGNEAAQNTANDMVKLWNDTQMKPARDAYTGLAPKIAATKLPADAGPQFSTAVKSVLDNERNTIEVQRVLDTDIGKTTSQRTITPVAPAKKTTTTVSQVEYPGKKIVNEKGVSVADGSKTRADAIQATRNFDNTSGAYGPAQTSKEATKTTTTEIAAKPGRTIQTTKPRTVRDLLAEVDTGKTPNAREWDSVSQELKTLADQYPTASRVSSAIDDVLHQYVPELKAASDKWAAAMDSKKQLETIVGPWDDTLRVQNPENLYSYFERLGDSPLQNATRKFDEVAIDAGRKPMTPAIKDIAAFHSTVNPIRPALTALSIFGGGAYGLHALGVPEGVIAALGAGLAIESTPYLSARGGRALARVAAVVRDKLDTPAGKYLVGQATARQLTGRNNSPQGE